MRAGVYWNWLTTLLILCVATAQAQQRQLAGHAMPVRAVAYTPDGSMLITAGEDGKLLFRDRPEGKVVRAFTHGGQSFSALTVSPDGAAVAAGSTAGQLVHITLPEGEMQSWAGPAGVIAALSLSADGRHLLSGDAAGTTRLWDLSTRQVVREFAGTQAVTVVAFSPDNSVVTAATADGGLRAWNRENGQLLGVHISAVATSLWHDPEDKALVSLSNDGLTRRWQWPPEAPSDLSGHKDVVSCLALADDGKLAISGGHDGQVLQWDFAGAKLIRPLTGVTGKVTAAGLTRDAALAVAGTDQGVLQFWNTADGTNRGSIASHNSAVTSLVMLPGSPHLAATYADGAVRSWRLPEPEVQWSGHQGAISHLATSLDRKTVISCGTDKSVRVWDATTGKEKRAIEALPLLPQRACLSADGRWMAWSNETGQVQIEQTNIGNRSFALHAHTGPLAGLALLDSGKLLVTAGSDGSLKYWPLPLSEPESLGQIDAKVTVSSQLPDGNLLIGDEKGNVRDVSQAGKELWKQALSSDAITAVSRLADGTFVAADAEGQLHFWSERRAEEAVRVGAHHGAITAVAAHPTDSRCATAGADGTIRIWRVPGVRELLQHERAITVVAASPDGRSGATGDEGGRVHRWHLAETRHDLALGGGEAKVSTMAFTPLGGLATGDALGEVRFYAEDSSEPTSVLGTHDAAVSRLAFHPAAPFVATASTDGRVRVWNVQNESTRAFARLESPASQLVLTSDQNRMFVATDDGELAAFDANTGQEIWLTAKLSSAATALSVSHDNNLVAMGLPTGETYLFSSLDGTPRGVLGTGFTAVRGIAFRAGSDELATIHDDDVVRVWKLPPLPQVWSDHSGDIMHAVAAHQGSLVATAATDRTVRLWNTADGTSSWILGHAQRILSLAMSADGSRVASLTTISARAWNTADGSLAREWNPLPSAGTSVAISADGKTLWTGHADGKLRLWNVDTGESVRTVDAHTDRITALGRVGNSVVSAGEDAQLKLWSPDRAEAVWAVAAPKPIVSLIVDAKDTQILARDAAGDLSAWSAAAGEAMPTSLHGRAAAVGEEGHVVAYDAGKGVELHQLEPAGAFQARGLLERFVHGAKLRGSLAVLANGQAVVSGDTKRRVILWRRSILANQVSGSQPIAIGYVEGRDRPTWLTRTGRIRHYDGSEPAALPGVEDVVAATMTRDGNRIAALGKDQSLTVWDHKQNQLVARISLPVAGTAVSIGGDGQRAAVVGEDGIVRVWHLDPPRQLRRIGQGERAVQAIVSAASDWVAVAFENGSVRRYAASDYAEVVSHGTGFTTCAYWPNGERLLTAGTDRYLRSYDREYKPLAQVGPFDAPLQALAVRPDGGQVLLGDGKQLYVLGGDNLQVERKQELPGGCVGIQYLGQGAHAVLACGDGRKRIIQTSDGRVLEDLSFERAIHPFAAIASPESTLVLAGGPKNSVQFIRTGLERIILGHQGSVNSLAWSPTGTMLVSGGADKIVRQWNAADGAQQRLYPGHQDAVTSVALSHDGNVLFSGGIDRTVRAWPLLDPGRQLLAVTTPSPIREITLSADSSRIFVRGDDGLVRVFDATNGAMIEQLPVSTPGSFHVAADGAIVSITGDGRIQRFALNCGKHVYLGPAKIHLLAAFPNDQTVTVTCEDRTTRIFDAEGKQLLSLAGPPTVPTNVASDGKVIVAAGDAAASQPHVWGWDAKDGRHLFTHPVGANVVAVALSPAGRIAAGTSDRRVLILEEGQLLQQFSLPGNATRLVFLDDVRLAAIAGDQHVHLLHVSCDRRYAGQQGPTIASAASPDGKLLLTGGSESILRAWETASGKQRSAVAVPAGVVQVRVSSDGNHIVAACLDGKLLRWSIKAFDQEQAGPPDRTYQLPAAARALAVDAKGERAVVGCDDGWVRFIDLSLGKELERQGPQAGAILAAVWRPESGRVFCSAADRSFSAGRLGVVAATAAAKETMSVIAMNQDGTRIAGVDATGLLIARSSAGELLATQQLPTKVVHRVAWSPEGKEIAVATDASPIVVRVKAKP